MTRHDDRPATLAEPRACHGRVNSSPPKSSKIAAGLAALACAVCCALPFLIAAGVLTGAGAAIAEQGLLAAAALLLAAAGALWWGRAAQASECGCGCSPGT
ncbi:hypothetical protein ABGB08_05090 [Acrocarpospora sp. B8E8]